MRASLRLAIQVTPCGKALLSPPTAMGSHVTISNYWGVGKRRSRRLYQRTQTIGTNAPAPFPQRPTPLPNHSLNSLDSTVMQLLHPSHPPVAKRIRRRFGP